MSGRGERRMEKEKGEGERRKEKGERRKEKT
jgi:hypothetical protein